MKCKSARDWLYPYLLDALDESEKRRVESHLESCADCMATLRGDDESAVNLAFSLPRRNVRSRVKERLMERVEGERRGRIGRGVDLLLGRPVTGWLTAFGSRALAPAIIVVVALAGVWINETLGETPIPEDEGTRAPAGQSAGLGIERTPGLGTRLAEPLAPPAEGASVNMLVGSGPGSYARGMVMWSRTSNIALVLVADLPPLPYDEVYQIWLIKDGWRYAVGCFNVDSTGYGQTVIIPMAPFLEFDAAGITIESRGGSAAPAGESVLEGEL